MSYLIKPVNFPELLNLVRRGHAYARRGEYGRAVEAFSGAIDLDPTDGELGLDDLPEEAGVKPAGAPGAAPAALGTDHLVGRPLEEVERYYMEKALELTGGNREEAAKVLKISERTMYRKIGEWKKEGEKKSDE